MSSDADVRPFIYLKRINYERDQALATAVENHLRKGESKEFLDLLAAAESPSEQEGIVRIATDLTSRWLDAHPPRDIFLKNSGSVLLKAAGRVTGIRSLELAVSNLLEHVRKTASALDLVEVFSLPDLFAFRPTIATAQKEKCLERIVGLVDANAPLGRDYPQRTWGQFLDHESQLSDDLRLKLRPSLESGYRLSESTTLELLVEASRRKTTANGSEFGWVVSPPVLEVMAGRLTFLDDEADGHRISVLTAFRSKMDRPAKDLTADAIVKSVQGARTRNFDTKAKAAVEFLSELAPEILEQPNLDTIAALLIEQVTAQGNYQLKVPWRAALVNIRGRLSAGVQASVDNLYRPLLQDPTDPAALVQILTGLTPPVCARLLAIP